MSGALEGRTAVVTGGAGQGAGLGRGLVRCLAGVGMNVAILDIDRDAASALALELKNEGREALGLGVDVTSPESLQAAAEEVARVFGSCSVLCAHVGGGGQGRFLDLPLEAWAEAMQLMVTGTVATVQAFLPLLQRTEGLRRIVLTASVAALTPGRFQGPYRAAKAAVVSIGETLDLELGPDGIGTTIVFPGGMVPPALLDLARALAEHPPDPESLEMAIAAEMVKDPTDVDDGEAAAVPVLEAILASRRYVITHGKTAQSNYEDRHKLIEAAFGELANRRYRPAP
jgi:NAD(P)-dependent dehydrogenase (short-subunit alcohol dehydrogenase family)